MSMSPGHVELPTQPFFMWCPPPPTFYVLQMYFPFLLLYVMEQQRRRQRRRQRCWQARIVHPPDNPVACLQAYRLDRGGIEELCQLLGPHLQPTRPSVRSLPVTQKVLMALHFLATGAFQSDVARIHGTSQSTASRCVDEVVRAVVQESHRFMVFPVSAAERRRVREGFYAIAGFPNVVGAVDGTHVNILAPSEDPGLYRNRHHQHSINVQATCDAQCLFTSVNAKFPGSVHDAQVFDASRVKQIVAAWPEGDGWLLGDRGYPLRPYLLTPYPEDTPGPRACYNVAHRRSRIVVERAFGQLKHRFRSLHLSGSRLMRAPDKAAQTVAACMLLHNLCVRRKTPLLEGDGGQGPMHIPRPAEGAIPPPHQDPRGVAIRERVTALYFS